MPRVPLHKLKSGHHQVVDVEKGPNNHVGTFANRIAKSKMGKRQAKRENVKSTPRAKRAGRANNGTTEMDDKLNSVQNKGATLKHKKVKMSEQAAEMREMGDSKIPSHVSGMLHNIRHMKTLNVNRKQRKQLEKIESLLEKFHKAHKLRQSAEESSRLSGDSNCDTETSEGEYDVEVSLKDMALRDISNELDEGGRNEITLDVHNEEGEEELEGAVGGIGELYHHQDTNMNTYTEEDKNDSDSSLESDQFETHRLTRSWSQSKHTQQKRKRSPVEKGITLSKQEIQWGEEESSDSDSEGGWDFETGGMPLLPR